MNDEQLEALYGPLAPYSEHKRGDTIRYRYSQWVGGSRSGTVIWVCAAGPVVQGGEDHPLRYIVDAGEGMPDTVYPQEVVE